MNRLDAFLVTMSTVADWKRRKIDQYVEASANPDELLVKAEKAKIRIDDKKVEWVSESVLVPHLRQRAIDSMYVIDIPALIANPDMDINPVPIEGISSTTVGEPEGERE